MADEESRKSIPFEPPSNKQRKKPAKQTATPIVKPPTPTPVKRSRGDGNIPDIVSNRMIRRVLVFSGIPVVMGMGIFILGYFALVNHWFPVSNTVVLLTSMACLGLSVVGLSYGILSASWEEDSNIKGSLLGWQECKTNFGRMVAAYRDSKRMRAEIDRQR